jgi:hypothetical protein
MRIMIRRAQGGVTNLEIPVDARLEELLTKLRAGELGAIHLHHAQGLFTIETQVGVADAPGSTEAAQEASYPERRFLLAGR